MKTVIVIDWKKVAEAAGFIVTVVAAAPYTLGEVAEFFPPKWKSTIFVSGAIATTLIKLWRSLSASPPESPVQVSVQVDQKK